MHIASHGILMSCSTYVYTYGTARFKLDARGHLLACNNTCQSSTKWSLECMACLFSCNIKSMQAQKSRYEHTSS